VRGETERLGGKDIVTHPGAVSWSGRLESGYRACLWSRFASRVLLHLHSFAAPDPDTLYRQARTVDWENHFTPEASFAVFCSRHNATIRHSRFAALRVKDAVADAFRAKTGRRPDVDVQNPDIRINLHLRGDQAVLALDLSGAPLHQRGYRVDPGPAPIKETLAAAVCFLSGLTGRDPLPAALLDPMCGSGTLLIEAALILSDTAPGLQRKRYGFSAWLGHNPALWQKLVEEALDRETAGLQRPWPLLIGFDCDPRAVRAARHNIVRAGLEDRIRVEELPLARLRPPADSGLLITNPPYGERLSDRSTVRYLYQAFDQCFGAHFSGWRLGFLAAHPDLAELPSLQRQGRYRLHNGPIACRLLTGVHRTPHHSPAPALSPRPTPAVPDQGNDLANRIRKNYRQLEKWLQRNNISCYRIYDADIPAFNLAVDVYETRLHVQEYAPPRGLDPEKAGKRFKIALQVLGQIFGCDRSRIFIKTRQRQKGGKQYRKKERPDRQRQGLPSLVTVREGGLKFLVNLADYLDTGLFLDHRKTRSRIRRMAKGCRFLNLFGYTGTATVYAADGRAAATTTVDASRRYLDWARANLALNGFGGPGHDFVRADCLEWLAAESDLYDLIFCDPPTFSNARHQHRTFAVQKDHPTLIRLAMARLSRQGILVFSTNFRSFSMDRETEKAFFVREITHKTLPRDFARRRMHRCFLIRHPEVEENDDSQ